MKLTKNLMEIVTPPLTDKFQVNIVQNHLFFWVTFQTFVKPHGQSILLD